MEYCSVPQLSGKISRICLGTMLFGNPVAEPEAIALTHAAMERGVNFIDTADIYEGYDRSIGSHGGVAERILGRALRGKRDKVIIASKVGNATGPGPDDQGLGRKHVGSTLEAILKRLGTDYLDIYYMHKMDPATPLEESIETFAGLVEQGKSRAWGVSNFSAEAIREIVVLCRRNGWPLPAMSQPNYSILRRDIEADHLPVCREAGIAVVPYRVLEGGLLSGKYAKSAPPPTGSRQAEKPGWLMEIDDAAQERLDAVRRSAATLKMPMSRYAIAWVLSRPGVAAAVVGVKNLQQLDEAVAAAGATSSLLAE